MVAIASQIILCLVLAALLGLIIGYLLGKTNCPKDAYKAHTPVDNHTKDDGDCGGNNDDKNSTDSDETDRDPEKVSGSVQPQSLLSETALGEEETFAPSDDDKPAGLLDAPDGKKDNLTRIKGIGVKIESQLNGIGVYHFRQIAAFTEKELGWVAYHTSFPGRALRDDWIGQAKLLAKGKETEFSKRVDAGDVPTSHES